MGLTRWDRIIQAHDVAGSQGKEVFMQSSQGYVTIAAA
jgi:hypothetical protein